MSMRRVTNRRFTRTLIIALILVMVLVAVAPAAFASSGPGCWGAGCRGKSPVVQGCGKDAYTVASKSNSHQIVQLRYSPACHAYWSRTFSKLSPHNIKFTRAAIKGHVSATRVVNWGGVRAISRMWTGPATACGVSVSKSNPWFVPVRCAH